MFNLLVDKQPKAEYDSCYGNVCETAEKCNRRSFNIRNDEKDSEENFLHFRVNV